MNICNTDNFRICLLQFPSVKCWSSLLPGSHFKQTCLKLLPGMVHVQKSNSQYSTIKDYQGNMWNGQSRCKGYSLGGTFSDKTIWDTRRYKKQKEHSRNASSSTNPFPPTTWNQKKWFEEVTKGLPGTADLPQSDQILSRPPLSWDKKPENWKHCWQISVQKRWPYPWGQLAVDESWVNMWITTRAPSKQIPGICLLQLGHLESRCGMWLVKLAYSKKIWVWDGLSGFQWCVANWFGGADTCLGQEKM